MYSSKCLEIVSGCRSQLFQDESRSVLAEIRDLGQTILISIVIVNFHSFFVFTLAPLNSFVRIKMSRNEIQGVAANIFSPNSGLFWLKYVILVKQF